MGHTKILLLDFNISKGLGHTLQAILDSPCGEETETGQRCFEAHLATGATGLDEAGLKKTISRASPSVICAILPRAGLKQMISLLQSIKAQAPKIPVAVVAEAQKPDDLFKLLQAGAADFFALPLQAFDILPRILRLIEHARKTQTATHRVREQIGLKQLIGGNTAFLAEIKKIPVVANCDASVLISGETGTGKELCARAIHYLSPRNDRPFLPINCGAVPAELMENELFGHERGAFTDAHISHPGLIREAEGGTLFLDEIDAIPPLAQVKLLRFLQDKEYRALGSNSIRKADVRIIAATNAEPEAAVAGGKLRADFYYRLSTIEIKLPPLRERREDITLFVQDFLSRYAARYGKQVSCVSSDALESLLVYDWPGNVRELEHTIERAVVMCEATTVRACDISLPRSEGSSGQGFKEAKAKIVAQFEKSYLQGLLLAFQGNITKAAQAANKNRRAFWELMRKHGIDVHGYKPGKL